MRWATPFGIMNSRSQNGSGEQRHLQMLNKEVMLAMPTSKQQCGKDLQAMPESNLVLMLFDVRYVAIDLVL